MLNTFSGLFTKRTTTPHSHFNMYILPFQIFTLLQKYLYLHSLYPKTWDSKYLVPIAQIVRKMNPKIESSSYPRFKTFFVWKTSTRSQDHPSVNRKWMLLLAHISKVSVTTKIFIPPEPVFKTQNNTRLAPIAQMVRAFSMNPKVGVSNIPRVEIFSVSKTSTLSQ